MYGTVKTSMSTKYISDLFLESCQLYLEFYSAFYSSPVLYLDKPSSMEAIRLFSRFSGREENFSGWISARKVTSLKYWAHRVGNCGGHAMVSQIIVHVKHHS